MGSIPLLSLHRRQMLSGLHNLGSRALLCGARGHLWILGGGAQSDGKMLNKCQIFPIFQAKDLCATFCFAVLRHFKMRRYLSKYLDHY